MGDGDQVFIAALDIGTTTIRCQILNRNAEIKGFSYTNVNLIYPQPGHVEINPDELWESTINIIRNAIHNAGLTPGQINCIGISTQRASFITWRKDNGKPFHNFITWKDLRADALRKQWNNAFWMKALKSSSYLLYLITRNKRYLAGSGIKVANNHINIRLLWLLENIPEIQEEIKRKNLMFGTIDTWLLYKLSGGKTFVTDYTNASATALFDPFLMQWSSLMLNLLKIPQEIMPKIVDNDYDLGSIQEEIFGFPIPIKSIVSDQSASMFSSCCFEKYDLKITLGTGSFLNMNTGNAPHSSVKGIYPLVGWKINKETVFITETNCNDTGSLIQWALNSNLLEDPVESSTKAESCEDNDGVYFIPAFSGLGPPINDDRAASGFLGVKPTTKKCHMIRAILESIVFRIVLALNVLKAETYSDLKIVRVDGGVSKNDFICQLLADMTGLQVERATNSEMSVLGAAFIAGLSAGIWKSKDDIKHLRKIDRTFKPTEDKIIIEKQKLELSKWLLVVERFKGWY